MYPISPARIPGVAGLTALLLAGTLNTHSLRAAEKFLPYVGEVSGTITVTLTPDGPVVASEAVQTATHLGRGPQVFTQMDLTGFLDGFVSPVITVSEGVAADGDAIFIISTLWAQPVSPSELVYRGEYEITGGTGRFGWSFPSLGSNYGAGEIVGAAQVRFVPPNQFLFQFANSFTGTIQSPVVRRR